MMPIAWIVGIAIVAIQVSGAQFDPCISEKDAIPISIEELKDHFDKYDGQITKISGRLSAMQYGTLLSDLESDEWIVVKSGKSSTADVHFNVCEDKLYESLSGILYESSIPRPPELFKKPLPSYVSTMRPFIIYRILLGTLLGSAVSALGLACDDNCADNSGTISICDLLSNAASYDGKEINIQGLYRSVAHGTILMGSASCAKAEINLRLASDYKEEKLAFSKLSSLRKKDRFQPVDVVLRGMFRVAQEGKCFGQICASYEIEVYELICARPHSDVGSPDLSEPKQ